MARIFGDEVVVNLDDVHINHDTHELVIGGGALEYVATHQGREKGEMVHREDVKGV
jgi:hypothetical protein